MVSYLGRKGDGSESMPREFFAALTVVSAVLLVWQLVEYGGASQAFYDTSSYFHAWDYIKTIHSHQERPPVYPFLVGGLRDMTGIPAMRVIVALIQWALFVAVLPLAWQLCRRLGAGAILSGIAVSLYLIVPGLWVLNNVVLPESICGSLIVLLLWLVMIVTDSGSRRAMTWSAIIILVMVMSKPVFIYLVAVIPVAWFTAARKHGVRKRLPAALITGMAAVICLYCMAMQHTHLVFSPCKATDYNRYIQLREEGLMQPQDIDMARDELRELIAGYYARDPGTWHPFVADSLWHEMGSINWPDLHWLNNNAMAHHPWETAVMYLKNFPRSADYDLFYNPLYPPGVPQHWLRAWNDTDGSDPVLVIYPFYRQIRPQLWVGWAIGLWFVALWLWRWWRSGRFPAVAYAVGASMIGGYIVSIAGAPDDWGRLLTPINMLLPIMLASALAALWPRHALAKRKRNEKKSTDSKQKTAANLLS